MIIRQTLRLLALTLPALQSLARERVGAASWWNGLPQLRGATVILRELRRSDAVSLFLTLTTEEVLRFMPRSPGSVEGFERFISRTIRQRAAGECACFAVTVRGLETAIGMFQVRTKEPGFATAEWGFAIGSPFWGTGVFEEAAELVLDFVFERLGAHRLEARTTLSNSRASGALRKLGAVQETVLHPLSRPCESEFDNVVYTIVEDERAGISPASRRRVRKALRNRSTTHSTILDTTVLPEVPRARALADCGKR